MKSSKKGSNAFSTLIILNKNLSDPSGTLLVYMVVLLLIFGVLGVSLVSLFTTSTTSSATPNSSKRARYIAESGVRYAFSELRDSNFARGKINDLNSLTYTVENEGNFNVNVFGTWFKSSGGYDGTESQIVLDTDVGEIPDEFPTIPSNMYIVNLDFVGSKPDKPGQTAEIQSIPSQTNNSITVDIGADNLVASIGELIGVAVQPYNDPPLKSAGDTLNVSIEAKDYFPERDGAIFINGNYYFYKTAKPDSTNTYVELTKLSQLPTASGFPFNMAANDFVILAPNNYLIIAEGEWEDIKFGGNLDFYQNINDLNYPVTGKRDPDVDEVPAGPPVEKNPGFIQPDVDDNTITIGGGGGQDDFGGIWDDENRSIGGDPLYCTSDGCLFGDGIRVFFVLNFVSQGDGITFALINGVDNNTGSIGGDIDLSELLAYAGDSRLVTNPDPLNPSHYLGSTNHHGLKPPKMAVEFDTRTNNDTLEYCSGPLPGDINVNTRNDPLSGNKDAAQFVFWGQPTSLIIPCRDNSPLYDDNRHDVGDVPTEFWPPFSRPGIVRSSPAIDPIEGAIYVGYTGGIIGKVYKINLENGSEIWQFTPEDPIPVNDINVDSSPALDANGNVYIGSDDNFLYAINKNGNKIWSYPTGDNVESTPAVSESRNTVYVEAESTLHAVDKDNGNSLIGWPLALDICSLIIDDDELESSPTIGPNETVYIGSKDGCFYAVNPDDRNAGLPFPTAREWIFLIGAEIRSTPVVDDNGTPIDFTDDTIYVGSNNGKVYAFNPDGTPKGAPWPFSTPTGPILSSPAIDTAGNIYVGSDDGHLYKIAPGGTEIWRFPDPGIIGAVQSSPVIDSDGFIYVGSNDGNIYAINPDGSEKWNFPTGGPVISSPAISGGIIFVGSNDGNLWAINQFIDPRNIKFKLLTPDDLGPGLDIGDADNWLNGDTLNLKPWAVRLELDRGTKTVSGITTGVYRLSLWMRQCIDLSCSNIINTAYQDTRIDYEVSFDGTSGLPDLPMTQEIEMDFTDHGKFDRFRWGFTSAVDALQTQNVTISQFQLSFIRPSDHSINTDILWNTELGL
jgi:outer membrane protein assembly factor BamB